MKFVSRSRFSSLKWGVILKRIVPISLIIFSVVFFYLALQDQFSIVKRYLFKPPQGQELGWISEKSNNVLRRSFGTPSYFGINQDDGVFNLDYIFSGEASFVTVNLSERSSVKILDKSLVIFRNEGGKTVIDLRDGKMELDVDPKDPIKIKTQKERLDVLGEEQTQIKVSTKNGLSFLEGGASGGKISHNGQTHDLSEAAYSIDEEGKGTSTADLASSEKSGELEPDQSQARLPGGVSEMKDIPKDLKRRNIPVPYPPNQIVLFHKKGIELLVYPRKTCKGECKIKLFYNEKLIKTAGFKNGEEPFISLKANKELSGVFTWSYIDFSGQKSGSFEVRKFNSDELKKAMKNSKQIEIVN